MSLQKRESNLWVKINCTNNLGNDDVFMFQVHNYTKGVYFPQGTMNTPAKV